MGAVPMRPKRFVWVGAVLGLASCWSHGAPVRSALLPVPGENPFVNFDAGARTSALPRSVVVLPGDAGLSSTLRTDFRQRATALHAYAAAHPPQSITPHTGAPPDPRVEACKTATADKPYLDPNGLKACLDRLSNGAFVVAPDAGQKVGAARPPPRCPIAQISPVHIKSTGNNGNSCVDSAHPCADPMEWQARSGCGGNSNEEPWNNTAVQYVFDDSMIPAQDFAVRPHIAEDGSFDITCAMTQIGSGTLGTVTVKNNLASQALNVDLGASAASYVNSLIHNTTHDSWAIVDLIVTGNVALISQPFGTGTDLELDVWAPGDAYTIQQRGTLYLHQFEPSCGTQFGQTYIPQNCHNAATIHNCQFPSVSHAAGAFWNTALSHVHMYNSALFGLGDLKSVTASNSIVSTPFLFQNSVLIGGTANALFISGVGDQYGTYIGSDAIIHGSLIMPPMSLLSYDAFWSDPSAQWFIQGQAYPAHMPGGSAAPYVIARTGHVSGSLLFSTAFDGMWALDGGTPSNATQSFGAGVVLSTDMGNFAIAQDVSQPLVTYSRHALTPATFDLSYDQGGFDSRIAFGAGMMNGFINWGLTEPVTRPQSMQPYTAIPGWLPNPALWVRADYATVSGGNVTAARDESGQNGDLTRALGVPTYTASCINGAPCFHFANNRLLPTSGAPALGLGDNSTVFLVMRSSGGGAGSTPWRNTHIQFLDNVPGIGTNWGTYDTPYLDSGHNVDDGLPHILVIRTTSVSNVDLITDGMLVNRTSGTAYQSFGNDGFGAQADWTGDIPELKIYNYRLSDDQVDAEDQELGGRYGVPVNYLTGGNLYGPRNAPIVGALQNTNISTAIPSVTTPPQVLTALQVVPSLISGLAVDLNSDLGTTIIGGKVSSWLDQSPNAYTVTQPVAGNRPVYTASGGAGGHAYLTYPGTGSNVQLNGTIASITDPFDVFVVTDKTGDGRMWDFAVNDHEGQVTGGAYIVYNSGTSAPPIPVSNGLHVYEANFNGNLSILGVDGVQTPVTGPAFNFTGTTLTIGNYNGGNNDWSGRYYRFIAYNHTLSTPDRNALCAYMHAFYGATCAGATSPVVWAPQQLIPTPSGLGQVFCNKTGAGITWVDAGACN
jgi:hypothetical protein